MARAALKATVVVAAAATAAVAQNQCIWESNGKSFDLSLANNGKCVAANF